jgi:hypothetical protein
MEESENLRRTTDLWQAAYRYQMEVELDRAIEHYQRSIGLPHGRGAYLLGVDPELPGPIGGGHG